MSRHITVEYQGGLPGISATVDLIDTTAMDPSGGAGQNNNFSWVVYRVTTSHAGVSVDFEYSTDSGTTWRQIATSTAVAAGADTYEDELYVGGLRDFRVRFVNDSTAQTTFDVNVSVDTDERAASGT